MFEYIQQHYKVPAEYGREVLFEGKRKGVIVSDEGNYIGVNFYDEKPNIVRTLHPTSDIVYLQTGKIRKITAGQKRYQQYLNADSGLTFFEWIKAGLYKYN